MKWISQTRMFAQIPLRSRRINYLFLFQYVTFNTLFLERFVQEEPNLLSRNVQQVCVRLIAKRKIRDKHSDVTQERELPVSRSFAFLRVRRELWKRVFWCVAGWGVYVSPSLWWNKTLPIDVRKHAAGLTASAAGRFQDFRKPEPGSTVA